MKRTEWTVVVAGKWNRAIFTPSWVSSELFKFKPEDSQLIRVMVALDELAPYQLSNEAVTVVAQSERLIVRAESPTFETLEKAKVIAVRAVTGLPVTPLVAAGMNCRFTFDDAEGNLANLIDSPLDYLLNEVEEFTGCTTRQTKRTVDWRKGQINISVDQDCASNKFGIEINIHQSSTSADALQAWLETPIEDIQAIVGQVFTRYFGIQLPESSYAA